ncbi:unnamed protein product [Clonostachys rosea]|uniref:FAD-dependent urate hydroxylase HpyO/Asp monooxygenase CreE-like FAD/NAD(P)-binding domain-containing protein n=1 Tax=Bionectria ochroleuca TaxID=29856 RepID=A0ABY6U725_BIOOC|nr:unnamed protein product [Clonostachys rosea]
MTLISINVGSPVETRHIQMAIVGAGPRGTSSLERVLASADEFVPHDVRLTVHIVDPSAPGPGTVWRTAQSSHLLMNTVTSQITLFTDDSVVCDGPIRQGPSLYDWALWAEPGLGPDDYATRAQYGKYLAWVFNDIVIKSPRNVHIEVHAARAIRLDDDKDGSQVLVLSNGETLRGLSTVVLAQGHLPLFPDSTQQQLAMFATRHGLRYLMPSNPADVDLSPIAPGEPVFLRGLGLNFFDYMALLSTGRGGYFSRASGRMRYYASGNEPRIYAGSRRGIPYHARGDNAKGASGRHLPVLLTNEVIASFHKRARAGEPLDFKTDIWPLLTKELEIVYYEALLGKDKADRLSFRKRFLATEPESREEAEFLVELDIPEASRWSWSRITEPFGKRKFATAEEWRKWMLDYLREDVKQAELGNVEGPLKAALDVMRDLRNEVRLIVDHYGLSGASRRDHLDKWYTPLNAYLSIGPPRERIEQMVALIEAGVLDVLGPQVHVEAQNWAWVAHSPEIPGSEIRVKTLIEARLPEPNLRHTADELLAHLLHTGQCRPHTVGEYETGGLDVTQSPYHLIDGQGRPHEKRFVVGVPTEGVHWVTAAGARPGVNSVTLTDTDAVARAVLIAMTKRQNT